MTDKEIITQLRTRYSEEILDTTCFPQAYCPGETYAVKAIYLGCDPSNKHSTQLLYVFAHECGIPVFNRFIKDHTEQLQQIGLNWDSVYTQNLCRNYFDKETAANKKLWKRMAEEYWIEALKSELSIFPESIPVLLTAQILLEVLGKDGFESIEAPDFYQCKVPIPVPAESSKLNRCLIPVYRGKSPRFKVSYHLKNREWSHYRNTIISFLKNDHK